MPTGRTKIGVVVDIATAPDSKCNCVESGLYYLQSRCYNPTVGRFINSDTYAATGQGLLGNNMLAYCGNNPVNAIDKNGFAFLYFDWVSDAISVVGDWINENIAEPLNNAIDYFTNSDEQTVLDELEATGFGFYKGTPVVRIPWDGNAASFGIIFMGDNLDDGVNTLRHEYGHREQLEALGLMTFTSNYAVPSLIGNGLDRLKWNTMDYYDQPWEYKADELGGVTSRKEPYSPWAKELSDAYFGLSYVKSYVLKTIMPFLW